MVYNLVHVELSMLGIQEQLCELWLQPTMHVRKKKEKKHLKQIVIKVYKLLPCSQKWLRKRNCTCSNLSSLLESGKIFWVQAMVWGHKKVTIMVNCLGCLTKCNCYIWTSNKSRQGRSKTSNHFKTKAVHIAPLLHWKRTDFCNHH